MNRLRDPRWFLILAFLLTIGSVPVVQVVLEARQEEGVRVLEVFSQAPTAANLRTYERNLESANWAARATRGWVQFAQFAWLGYGGGKAVLGSNGWYFYKPGLQDMLARPPAAAAAAPVPVPGATATNDPVSAIVGFRDQLASRGVRLVVMPVPNKESIYPDRITARGGGGYPLMSPRTREVLVRLRAAGVETIDLFEAFGAERRRHGGTEPDLLYLTQDTHWSPAGMELAARTVAARLRELGWVRDGTVAYDTRPAPIQRLGDIVRMLQVPAIERRVAPETVPCRQVFLLGEGRTYADSPEADVLILGDSFMRIYQQDQPGGAGFIAHLARELRQPMLSLVNDGGGSTLVRRELYGRPAFLAQRKVVLWEFVERDLGLGLEGWKSVPLPPVAAAAERAPARTGGKPQ